MFDFGLLNVFGVFIGFEKNEFKSLRAVALSDCLLFSWSLAELECMAIKCAPVVAAFWRNLILCQVGIGKVWVLNRMQGRQVSAPRKLAGEGSHGFLKRREAAAG